MSKKLTLEQFLSKLDSNILLIGIYSNTKIKTIFQCKICNHIWEARPSNIIYKNDGCPNCNKLTTNIINDRLIKMNSPIRMVEQFKTLQTRSLFYSFECNHTWLARPNNILQGNGCRICYENTLNYTKINDIISVRNLILVDQYTNSKTRIKYKCLVCDYTWEQTTSNILRGSGCPCCAKSGFDPTKPGILYYVKINHNDNEYYKIGITNKTVEKRFKKYEMNIIEIIFEKHFSVGKDAYETEQKILKENKSYAYKGPKILKSGNTEIFIKDIFK